MEKSNPKKSVLAIFKMSQRVADIYEPVQQAWNMVSAVFTIFDFFILSPPKKGRCLPPR